MRFSNSKMPLALLLGAMLLTPLALMAETCVDSLPIWQEMPERPVYLRDENGVMLAVNARIADNRKTRAAGYQWLCAERARGSAILFVFDRDVYSVFHMMDVFTPLQIFFFDADGRLIHSEKMRAEPPGTTHAPRIYRPLSAYRYALEMPQSATADQLAGVSGLVLEPYRKP